MSPFPRQHPAGEENCLNQMLQEHKAEKRERKGVNITKQEYSANASVQEKAPFAEHQCYTGQNPPAHMMCGC